MTTPADIFISHGSGDSDLSLRLAHRLEHAGFTAWTYERDSLPGPSWLIQTGDAIAGAQAVILIVSEASLNSIPVTKEVDCAHNSGKPIVPVLVDIEHRRFMERKPEWREAVGSAVSVNLAERGLETTCRLLIQGLRRLNVTPRLAEATMATGLHRGAGAITPSARSPIDPDSIPGQLAPPVFQDLVRRESALEEIDRAMSDHGVVVIGGLSGSGKTYLLASYLSSGNAAASFLEVLWYDPTRQETVDDLCTLLTPALKIQSTSTIARCKEILAALKSRRSLLVIDDFHTVDQASYSVLVDMAMRQPAPCRLVLISQSRVESRAGHDAPRHLELRGLTSQEVRAVLEQRGLGSLSLRLLRELMIKTDGLPFAVALFASLVKDFGRDPRELLGGAIARTERLRLWFDQILGHTRPGSRDLLSCLSVCEGPFNIGVVKLLSRFLGITDGEPYFEDLQRGYLVQRYSLYRWRVHDLVAHLCLATMDPLRQQAVHAELGRYFLRGLPMQSRGLLSDEDFLWKAKACRHLRRSAKDLHLAERVLLSLASTAKTHGRYLAYRQLTGEMIAASPDRDPWVDYHHAHCALILGQSEYSRQVTGDMLGRPAVAADPTLRLAASRLHAEALGAAGDYRRALEVLTEQLASDISGDGGSVALAHARSVLAWLYVKTEEYDKAASIVETLLADARRRGDKRGVAVGLTWSGIIARLLGSPDRAIPVLSAAAVLFRDCEDRRGQAWALSNRAECEWDTGIPEDAMQSFRVVSRIAADIGECGADYTDLLQRLAMKTAQHRLRDLVRSEGRRVSGARRILRPD